MYDHMLIRSGAITLQHTLKLRAVQTYSMLATLGDVYPLTVVGGGRQALLDSAELVVELLHGLEHFLNRLAQE